MAAMLGTNTAEAIAEVAGGQVRPDPLFTADIECIGCPVAISGRAGAAEYFFRARHGRWTLTVDNAVVASGQGEPAIPTALAVIADNLWSHYLSPEFERRDEERVVAADRSWYADKLIGDRDA